MSFKSFRDEECSVHFCGMISSGIRDLPVYSYCGLLDQLLEGCPHSQWKGFSGSLYDPHRLKNLVFLLKFHELSLCRAVVCVRVFKTSDLDSVSTWFYTCSSVYSGNKTGSVIMVYDNHCCNYQLCHPGGMAPSYFLASLAIYKSFLVIM